MKHTLKFAVLMLVGLALTACSSGLGNYDGPARGIDLKVDGGLWGMGSGITSRSLTYKHDTEKPLGTLTITPDGGLDMTGPAVEIYALKMFCDTAPNAAGCNGF